MRRARSKLAAGQAKVGRVNPRKSTYKQVIVDGENIIDQMVTNTVALNAFPIDPECRSFTLTLDLYPDFGTATIRKRAYLKPNPEKAGPSGMDLDAYELEAFAEGVRELVAIARERGFLPNAAQET